MGRSNTALEQAIPHEILCIEARPYLTALDGTVYLFLAMDAGSRYAVHMDVRQGKSMDDYIAFISSLRGKVDLYNGLRLAVDLPVIRRNPLMQAFRMVQEVICDREGIYRITEEFHVGIAAQSGFRAMN